ncbi:hypothetical protein PITC_018650 [Penicillium italicum]|uniref:Uncharacterized protein n=1 Tax=Penicillium italicum TaxID=40296 RepID=A0A0A2KCJ4_PENIT|nr:hypothetical protein PITC_018650 [Penicillium italicum]
MRPALGGSSPVTDGSYPIEETRGLGAGPEVVGGCDRCGHVCDSVEDDMLMMTCCVFS